MKLTTENVHKIFTKCLFSDGENTDNHVKVHAVNMVIGFNPEKLKFNEKNITLMLCQLPNSFMKSGGGGMSFLNMCNDENDNQWTGIHKQMDELVALGLAIEKLSFLMPRDMWSAFPGGMLYLVVECE